MTAYGILSLVKLGGEENLISALQAVRWISKHRNAQGGFVSTQVIMLFLPFTSFDQISGLHSSEYFDCGLLHCDMWTCRWMSVFQRNILPSSVLKMEVVVPPKLWYLPPNPTPFYNPEDCH